VYFHPFVPSQLHLVCPAPLSLPLRGKETPCNLISRRLGDLEPEDHMVQSRLRLRHGPETPPPRDVGLYRTVRRQTFRESVTVGNPETRGNASQRPGQGLRAFSHCSLRLRNVHARAARQAGVDRSILSLAFDCFPSHPGVPNFLRGGKGPVTNDARRCRPDDDPCFETTASAHHTGRPNSQDKGSRRLTGSRVKNDGVDERTSRHATWIDGRNWWIWFETKAVEVSRAVLALVVLPLPRIRHAALDL
jgi:hypothetical protein